MAKGKKFGAFGGVFTPSVLSILGVIMYLRLPWIVGEAGLISAIGIILVAHIISISTGLSVASIATNNKVGPGGSYFIISRSLGLPIGGTLGLALFVGFSFSVSLYLIGFAETVITYWGLENSLDNVRLIGLISLVSIIVITFISTSLSIKTQYLIMAVIVLSLLSVFMGKHDFTPETVDIYSFGEAVPWIVLFAIFFPAVTGFQAGVSMSGDLKNPRRDIPLGLMTAIAVGLIIYIGVAVFLGYTVDRDLLKANPFALLEIAWFPELVVAGIMGATISSAMGGVLGAPRILQAVSADRITPYVFAKGYGASNEPRNALILTFIIAMAGVMIGELNAIARIVTIFFIITYGFINITYTVESIAGTDFRPSFKMPRIISIIGALACIIVMIQLDLIALIGASLILMAIFLYLKRKELTLQSGDTWNGIWTSLVKVGLRKLMFSQMKENKWHPNIIVFTGGVAARPHLIDLAKTLVGKLGIFTSFQLIEDPSESFTLSKNENILIEGTHKEKNIVTRKHVCKDKYEGIDTISRIYGFSGFEPNAVLMGWPANSRNPEKFASILHKLYKLDYNQIYLKFDKEKAFGKNSSIDIWWRGKGKNLSMIITLLKFVKASTEWRRAKLRFLLINNKPELTESYYTLLNQIIDNQRILAEVKIINNNIEKLPDQEIIKSESFNSDLTIIEIPELTNKDAGFVYSELNLLCEPLKTCMLVKASSFFEEITPERTATAETATGAPATESFEIPDSLAAVIKPASKEIISNHIYNIANDLDKSLQKFVHSGLYATGKIYKEFAGELKIIVDKTITSLENDLSLKNDEERQKQLLTSLNDFAYHAKKHLSVYADKLILEEKETLTKGITGFIDETKNTVNKLPGHITIKEGKRRKKVRLYNSARYLIYYNRLLFIEKLQQDLVQHSFAAVSDLRKIFSGVHELIEKTRVDNTGHASTVIRMEKTKLDVNINDFEDFVEGFYIEASYNIYSETKNDLESLTHILEGAKSYAFDRRYKKAFRNETKLRESILEFPESWHKGLQSYINKGYIDFLFLSLNARINAKVLKHNGETDILINNNLTNPIKELVDNADKILGAKSGKSIVAPIDHNQIKAPPLEAHYNVLFKEIFDVVAELPEFLEISALNIAETKSIEKLNKTESYLLGIRKTAEFYISNELIDFVKERNRQASANITTAASNLRESIKLANFNIQASKESTAEPDERRDARHDVIVSEYIKNLKSEEQKIRETIEQLKSDFRNGLKKAFEPLSSAVIVQTSRSLKKKIIEKENKKVAKKAGKAIKRFNEALQKQFVRLLYTRSEGILWTEKIDDHTSPRYHYERFYSLIESVSPKPEVIKTLPFYYTNLFSGFSGIGEDFWVGMKEEVRKGEAGIKKFLKGSTGILIVAGKRSSGKSSLSKLLARKHFSQENIALIRAPKQATCDVELFKSELAKAFDVDKNNLAEKINDVSKGKKVAVINDLGLWWERNPEGDEVVNYIKSLINIYGNKLLFIININSNVYKVIEAQTSLSVFALANVECMPFDSRELKELIMLRHKASGLRFVFNKNEEDNYTEWDYAKLFNKIFNVSYGNPGAAIQLWLTCINKVTGKTLYMDYPLKPDLEVIESLSKEQKFILLQLLLQRRFSLDKMAALLRVSPDSISESWYSLIRWGIIYEKFSGIYSINPSIEHHLIEKFQNMKLL